MEQEYFFTGYCRTTDQSRTVTVVTEDGKLIEVDCCYENCVHAPNCTIAKEIEKQTEEA
ncbi:MAG: hypothetical protein IJZ14_01505 [Oscillospiraceae bacterium]|nr:hypothetical protein [Oscillospiraceae bacterium]